MNSSIIISLLAISASAVLSESIEDVEDAVKQATDGLDQTITRIMNAIGVKDREGEEVKEGVMKTKTGFQETVDSAIKGMINEIAVQKAITGWKKTLAALLKYTKANCEEISRQNNGVKFQEALYSALFGYRSGVTNGVTKAMARYSDVFACISKKIGNLDVTKEVNKTKEAYFAVFLGIYEIRNNNTSSVKDAAKQVADGFGETVAKLMEKVGVEDQDVEEAVIKTKTGFQETVDSAIKGKIDEKAGAKTIIGWNETIAAVLKYTNSNGDEISISISNAGVGLQEALQAALYGTRNEVYEGVKLAMTGYRHVFAFLSQKIGNVDVTDIVDKTEKAYYASFFGIYDIRINDALTVSSKSTEVLPPLQ